METNSLLEEFAGARTCTLGKGSADYALNVVVVYQDEPTRKWARTVSARVTHLLGENAVRTTWWNMHELNEPAVLAAAVSKTMRSDVVIVALRAAENLPLAFYVWVDTWLPHRPRESGALVALIGQTDQPEGQSDRARQYLRALALRGRLDFLVEERKLQAEPDAVMPEPVLTSSLGRTVSAGAFSSRVPSLHLSRRGSNE